MAYATSEKVAVMGAAGAVGSNVVQSLLATGAANRIAMYDPYEPGLEGAAEEIWHCAFPEADVTWTVDVGEALTGAIYVLSAGGAPRKEGSTREDLLRGNAGIAAQLGRDIKAHAPGAKLVVVIFNPADITGLVTLVHSGLEPRCVTTLAALDSTRLQTRLARHFRVTQDHVTGCRTYGGHGQEMAVFRSGIRVEDVPLVDIIEGAKEINGTGMTSDEWAAVRQSVIEGGAQIIKLRGRSSFQSPGHQSAMMVAAAAGGTPFEWPSGAYVTGERYERVMMAMPTSLGPDGVRWSMPEGEPEELAELDAAYAHLRRLRDETIEMGTLPPIAEWGAANAHLA